jgi:GPN-loop GTPase
VSFNHEEAVQGFVEDDYLIVDCPGQIELFTHIPVLRTFVDFLKSDGWNVCAVFCLDSHFITDSTKFIAGCFQALSSMVTLELPHLNVLTKVDLLDDKVCARAAWPHYIL